ncbi:MAG: DUF3726 domain-containing protein [Acidimicrobiales bacterium]|nr:DUF3726 domain-containing protein [Acidimicrobiales bacterium]
MNLSLGEFQSLIAKAFRGAGYPWGLTEEAAFAARRLAEGGLPVGAMVVRLLQSVDGSAIADLMPDEQWRSSGPVLCAVCVGTSIADEADCEDLELGPTSEPIFIAPFLSATLDADDGGYVIDWGEGRCYVTSGGIRVEGGLSVGPVAVMIRRQAALPSEDERFDRVEVDDVTFSALATFAHRVYAPATEASRLAGAGAGTTDND